MPVIKLELTRILKIATGLAVVTLAVVSYNNTLSLNDSLQLNGNVAQSEAPPEGPI